MLKIFQILQITDSLRRRRNKKSKFILHLIDIFSFSNKIVYYSCFNFYCFKRTGLDVLFLMHRRSQSPPTLARLITECGAPIQMKSNNAPEFKSKTWTSFIDKMSIKPEFTEAHHPNEN